MKPIKFVTDSTADIPPELLKKYDIRIAPIAIQFDKETFDEGHGLTRDEFFRRIDAGVFPKTSQPPAGAFAAIYRDLAKEASSIISINITSAHSGTVQSATLAKEMVPEADVEVVDSQAISMGTGFQVLAAARAAEQGRSKEEILGMVRGMIGRMHHYLCLDTLKYLEMGGRVSSFQSMFASLLNVKAILTVKDGALSPYGRVRTRSKSIERLIEIAEAALGRGDPVRLAIMHTRAETEARQVADALKSRLDVREMFLGELALSLTVHAGPGLVGVIGYAIGPGEP